MRLGYILSRYPLLSETFILREMQELERQGHELVVFPLITVSKGLRHQRVKELRARIWPSGWLPLTSLIYWARRAPMVLVATWWQTLWYNRSDRRLLAGALAYWPKAFVIAQRMEAAGIEHVHAHYATYPTYVAWMVKKLTGIPYSFTVHAHDLYCHRAMLRTKVAEAQRVITISEYNRRRLHAHAGSQPGAPPISVIRCGVTVATYAAGVKRRGDGEGLRVVHVGSLQTYKGQTHLVAACGILCRRGVKLDCRIIGGGKLHRSLQRQIEREHLEPWVRLEGPKTEGEVQGWLRWADVFVLPSVVDEHSGQMEGIPVALMEAMAAGLAVVASKLSGIPELVQAGEGLLVTPGRADELATALLELRDPGKRRRLGAAAQEHVRREYDLEANVAALSRVMGWSAAPGEAAA